MSIHLQSHSDQPLSDLNNFLYFILLFSSLLFISPCRKLWLPNFLWYQASRNSIQTWLPSTSLFFLGGDVSLPVGPGSTSSHVTSSLSRSTEIHGLCHGPANFISWGGAIERTEDVNISWYISTMSPPKPWKIKVLAPKNYRLLTIKTSKNVGLGAHGIRIFYLNTFIWARLLGIFEVPKNAVTAGYFVRMTYFCTIFFPTCHQPDLSSLDSFDLHIVPCFDWIEAATVFPFAAGTSFLGSQKKTTDCPWGRTHLILCISLNILSDIFQFDPSQVFWSFVVKTMCGNLIQKLHLDQNLWVFLGDSFGARHGTSKGLSLVTSTPETTYSEHTAKKSEILHQLRLVVFFFPSPGRYRILVHHHQLSSCKIKIPILGGCCHICTWGCKALGILSCVRWGSLPILLRHLGCVPDGMLAGCGNLDRRFPQEENQVQLEGQPDSCKYTELYCTYDVSSFFSHITRTWFCNASYGHYKEVNQKNISANGACAKAAGPESGADGVKTLALDFLCGWIPKNLVNTTNGWASRI